VAGDLRRVMFFPESVLADEIVFSFSPATLSLNQRIQFG
jgi:hypothetical protein